MGEIDLQWMAIEAELAVMKLKPLASGEPQNMDRGFDGYEHRE